MTKRHIRQKQVVRADQPLSRRLATAFALRTGSPTQAAQSLGITKSAFHKRIRMAKRKLLQLGYPVPNARVGRRTTRAVCTLADF